MSIHRATTVGPKSPLCQVIIKNTSALRDGISSSSHAVVNRSQSLLTTNRIPVLAPSRSDRIRLERILADVWTRDKLPYPAMTGRSRGEHLVRSSASSMMRKLSVASITSNFSKRSGSLVSLTSFNRPSEDQPDVPRMPSSSATTVESSVDRLKQDAVQVFVTPLEKTPTAEVGDYLDLHFDEKATSGAPQRRTPTPTLDASLGKITQRIASRKIRNVLQFEGNRKTPPFRSHSDNSLKRPLGDRTTSGGSLGLKCASPGTPGSDRSQCSENQHPTTTQAKWAKVAGLHHLSSAERLGRFF